MLTFGTGNKDTGDSVLERPWTEGGVAVTQAREALSLRSVSMTTSVLEADSKLLEECPDSISLPESLNMMAASVATEEGDSSGVSLSEKIPPLPLDFLGLFSADPYDDLRFFSWYHLAHFSFLWNRLSSLKASLLAVFSLPTSVSSSHSL